MGQLNKATLTRLETWPGLAHIPIMEKLDQTDYSVVVKHNDKPPNSWRWEIYCAGKRMPIKRSLVSFTTMVTANRAGRAALKQLLDKLFV